MLFFELLQTAIGNRTRLSHTPTAEEWSDLYTLAQKQAMVGIAFRGVEQLPREQCPPKQLLMQWYMLTERIKAMNADLDRKALAVANKFLDEGFPGVVLKGQGIAKLYQLCNYENDNENCHPDGGSKHSTLNTQQVERSSISNYRTPGDIDIWLHGEREAILDYVRQHVPDCRPVYHHVDFPVVDGLDIEVHFTPSWMNSPLRNRCLQRFFKSILPDGDTQHSTQNTKQATLPVPDNAFNRVYILVHIYRHLFAEGIGLRQLLDYYFVLSQGFTEEERAGTLRTLRSLGMLRFTRAVMWVLQEVYGMDNRYLLTTPDGEEGRFLLNEIMLAGNFGQHDERMQHAAGESSFRWGLRKVKRNFRFVWSYPSEVLWSPIFKLWHYFWRMRRK